MLNKRDNKFIFNFPLGFIDPSVCAKFDKVVQKLSLNYSDTLSYLNSTIQGISLPGFEAETSEQRLNREPISMKNGIELHQSMTKSFAVTFKLSDGMLNWFILLMASEAFLSYQNDKMYHPEFTMRVLTNDNLQLFSYKIFYPHITSLDAGEFTYTSDTYDTKTFTASFKFSKLEIQLEED